MDFKTRADLVYSIVAWFEKDQKIKGIPVVIHSQPLAVLEGVGTVFGSCSTYGASGKPCCFLSDCKVSGVHIHVSLMTALEYFETELKGRQMEMQAISEVNLVMATFEELFHYWQNVTYPKDYIGRYLTSRIATKADYYTDPMEVEAKSFSYSMTERFIGAFWKGKSLAYLRDILFGFRGCEHQ